MGNWRAILLNRFVLVPGAIVLAIVLWNIYVATHNNGLLTGRVTDASGRPVADATVSLWVFNFTTYEEKERVKTDADGVFRFTDNPSHRIQISAEKPGVGRSQRLPIFLYFRSQDTTLDTPIRLSGAA
jgi:protocatechuate 3,4-dioxygenase beta subunit